MKKKKRRVSTVWEVLNGVGLDGVGGIFPFFFSSLFLFFFVFLRFFGFFVFLRFFFVPRIRANDCNLLKKWGISLRPRLHRPRSELPERWWCILFFSSLFKFTKASSPELSECFGLRRALGIGILNRGLGRIL